MVPGSTGTDTGGSIRQPAAFCCIVGLKPTYGRCSRWGVVAFASSLDQPGPFARTVEDSALLLQGMAGHDPKDSTSAPLAVPDFAAAARNPRHQGHEGRHPQGVPAPTATSPEIVALWDRGMEMLKAAGAVPVEVSLPHTKYALPAYYIVAPAECSSNLARYDGVRFGLRVPGKDLPEMYENTRGAGFGKEVRRRIMMAPTCCRPGYYDAYYKKAQQVRALIARDFKQAFEKCDVLLTPTAPTAAFAAGDKMDDPVTMYLNDMFTIPASMAGLPGISVPGRRRQGRPAARPAADRPRLRRGRPCCAPPPLWRRRQPSTCGPQGTERPGGQALNESEARQARGFAVESEGRRAACLAAEFAEQDVGEVTDCDCSQEFDGAR